MVRKGDRHLLKALFEHDLITVYFYIAAGDEIHDAGVRSAVGRTDKDQIVLYPRWPQDNT